MSIVHALRLHEHLSEQASAWLSLGESEAHSFLVELMRVTSHAFLAEARSGMGHGRR